MDKQQALEYQNQSTYFLGAEQYEDALEFIDKAIDEDRMNKDFYIQKSIILVNMDRHEEAVDTLNNALKIDKKFPEAYFHLGNIFLMNDEKGKGIENYNKAIAYGYDDSQIFYNLGLMYEDDGNDELAVRNYTKAILNDPLRVDARVRKASIYITSKKYPEALETLNELILADPDLYDGYHLKSLLLAEMGNTEQAIQVLEEAEKLFPKDPAFALDKVNILVMQQKTDEARELASKIEAGYDLELPQKRQLELEKARLFALEANMDELEGCLLRARQYTSEDDPQAIDAEATFLLVNCCLEKKDYAGAEKYSEELIKSDELAYAIPAYYTLPHACLLDGQKEKADILFKDSISKLRAITLDDPGLLDGYLFRALCHKEIGEYEKALSLSDYLLKVDDKNGTFHNLKAEVLFAMGQEDEAKAEKNIAQSLA